MKNFFLVLSLFTIQFVTLNGSKCQAQFWNTTGNTGTTAGTNFIGTTDAKDFVFKTNNIEKGRVKSNGLWQFGASGNLAKIDSAGNLSFAGTAAYKVAGNKYAFQYSGNPNYGLFFNSTSVQYEFRNGSATPIVYFNANTGAATFNSTLKVGAYTLPASDGTSGQVLKTNGAGVLAWSSDNGGTSQWTTIGSNIYYNSGNVGIGTTSPSAAFHLVSAGSNPMKVDGAANMWIGLYEAGTYRGYIGSYYSGNAADVDFGTGVGNTTGGVDLTIQGVPKLTVNADGNLTIGGVINNSLTVSGTTSYLRMNATNSIANAWSYSNDGFYNYVNCINAAGSNSIIANFAYNAEPYQFTVWGNAQATSFFSSSDRKLKTNIQSIGELISAIDVVKKLNPVTYDFRTEEYPVMNLPSKNQYGFIAQDLQQVLPNLVQSSNMGVKKDAEGNLVREDVLSVNYIELIPILTQAIKEQQQTIETKNAELDAEKKLNADQQDHIESLNTRLDEMMNKMNNFEISLSQCCSNYQDGTSPSLWEGRDGLLEQNVPNPFMQTSYIKFYIPSSAKISSIIITDLNGRVMKTFSNLSVGFGTVNISGSELSAGTYNYSLFIDGNNIDSKQLILTK